MHGRPSALYIALQPAHKQILRTAGWRHGPSAFMSSQAGRFSSSDEFIAGKQPLCIRQPGNPRSTFWNLTSSDSVTRRMGVLVLCFASSLVPTTELDMTTTRPVTQNLVSYDPNICGLNADQSGSTNLLEIP